MCTCTFNGGYADNGEAAIGMGANLWAGQHGTHHIYGLETERDASSGPAWL